MVRARLGQRGALPLMAVIVTFVTACLPATAAAAMPQQSGTVDLLTQANIQLDGAAANTWTGSSAAAAGDVNGDGRADLIVGASYADNNAKTDSGSAYVVFGQPSLTTLDLNALGAGGFRIDGATAGDHAGTSVAGAGDINGDGRPDLIVGAPGVDTAGTDAGAAYVVFGKASATTVDLSGLGAGGFRIDGEDTNTLAGLAVAGPGDVNGDGTADVIVGARLAASSGRALSGATYVVFGKATTTNVDLYTLGSGGFRIAGAVANDESGDDVAGAGDVNGDGRQDVLLGAPKADNNGSSSGSAYVVFGKASTTTVDLLALGAGGFRIDGAAANNYTGEAVAGAGDVNGDGRPDVIVGAGGASTAGRTSNGATYVVFGKPDTATIALNALGAGGFRIDGARASDQAGEHVAGAGDVNGDGRPDVIVASTYAGNNGRNNSGSAYVVLGKASTTTVDLNALGPDGFRIDGAAAGDGAGLGVAGAGDINSDGRPDVVVGSAGAGNNGRPLSGSAYVVFGFGPPSVAYPGPLNATLGQPIAPHAPTVARTGAPSFTVDPALPAGLVLDPATGVVSGTPTAPHATTTHTVTMTDLAGSAQAALVVTVPAPALGGLPDLIAPLVTGFKAHPKLFALGPAGTPLLAKARRGTSFRYVLSEAATTAIAIERTLPGRRLGKRCKKPSPKNKSKRPCTRYAKQGTLTRRNQAAGKQTVKFSGRLGRRALRPGAYRATIRATDAAGNRSKPKTATFKIVKR
jgi:hypothetical protein